MPNFTALRGFASKQYKFHQRKSIELAVERYGDDASSGVCMGVAMMWVQEKFTTTGAFWHPMQNKDFSPGRGGDVHTRNAETMLRGAGYQMLYNQRGAAALATHLGLRDATFDIRAVVQPDNGNRPEVRLLDTLVRVGEDLPEGGAAVIELAVRHASGDGGHAIAVYRSRGRHLYFFDPNVGVYQVRDIAGFMQAWIDGCRYGRGWTLSPFRQGNDWIHCYSR